MSGAPCRTAHYVVALCMLPIAVFSLNLHASQRTFVGSQGNDVANLAAGCTLPLPCRSFGSALTKTNVGGEIVVIDSAGYGTVTIDKSVSVIAPAGVYAGISVPAGQDGVTIVTSNVNVLLRGLVINGQGGHDGMVVNAANVELHVESCSIAGLVNDGLNMNSVAGTLFIRDSTFRDNAGVGFSITGVIGNIDRTRVERNGSDGIGIGQDSWATVNDSVVARNSGNGIIAYNRKSAGGGNTQLTVHNSAVTDNGLNGVDGEATGGSTSNVVTVSVTRSVISRNLNNGLQVYGDPTDVAYLTAVENTIEGNSLSGISAVCPVLSAIVTITNNVVTRNANGLAIGTSCSARSQGNNFVERNGNDIAVGGLTPTIAPGK